MGNTFTSVAHVIECQLVGGWKGWKKITIYWKIWGKWLENHIQIAEFWLESFLFVCGNPVIYYVLFFISSDMSQLHSWATKPHHHHLHNDNVGYEEPDMRHHCTHMSLVLRVEQQVSHL